MKLKDIFYAIPILLAVFGIMYVALSTPEGTYVLASSAFVIWLVFACSYFIDRVMKK